MAGISRFGTVCSIFIWLGVIFGFGFFSEYNYATASGDYSMWQDVHVMVFIGFGFLMSFMAKNSFTAVGHAMIAAAFAVVLSFFNYWVWHNIINHPRDEESWFRFRIGVDQLVNADFCAASILISFGAVIGRVSLMQLMTMTLFEVVFYSINEAIGYGRFGVADIGGSMIIHTFGAYFGLALSLVLDKKETRKKRNEEKAAPDVTPVSDTMAMAGVLFLWCFWPSFNGYFGDAADPTKTGMRQRAVVNTYLSLCASTVATYIVSSLIGKGRVSMVDVQNATLAGGVAMGTAANMLCMPYGALIIGTFAGTVSTLGFNYITPFLDRTIGLKDTCGVHNLHGMPGVIGAIAGIILSANAAKDNYSSTGYSWTNVWPNADSKNLTYKSLLGYQIATLFVTIGIAIFGGIVTGVLLRLFKTLPSFYDDHHEYFVHGDTVAIDAAKEMQAVEPIAA